MDRFSCKLTLNKATCLVIFVMKLLSQKHGYSLIPLIRQQYANEILGPPSFSEPVVQLISVLTSSKGQQILSFRSSNSLEKD